MIGLAAAALNLRPTCDKVKVTGGRTLVRPVSDSSHRHLSDMIYAFIIYLLLVLTNLCKIKYFLVFWFSLFSTYGRFIHRIISNLIKREGRFIYILIQNQRNFSFLCLKGKNILPSFQSISLLLHEKCPLKSCHLNILCI